MYFHQPNEIEPISKINEFMKLEKGWHYSEGIAPSQKIAFKAKALVNESLMNMLDVDVFPGVDGEIMVAVYNGNDCMEFTVESDETITFVHEIGGKQTEYLEGLTLKDAFKKITSFCRESWNSSELYTRNTMIAREEDLSVWHLNPHLTEGSPSFLKNVSRKMGEIVANTSIFSMSPELLDIPKFIGTSPFKIYQKNAALSPTLVPQAMSATGI